VGINSAVVGLLLAAFYDPVWSSGILSSGDFALALAALGLLTLWKTPPWLVVGATGFGGAIISSF
jgi:chromate transporter